MKTINPLMMAAIAKQVLDKCPANTRFEKDIKADAFYHYLKLSFHSGTHAIVMNELLFEFLLKHPDSKHVCDVRKMSQMICTNRKAESPYINISIN